MVLLRRVAGKAKSLSSSSQLTLSTRTTRSTPNHRRLFSSAPTAAYEQSVDQFPSLIIGANRSLEPVGSFAQAQAEYLDPDPDAVADLAQALTAAKMGVVAHYYMDVELQGVLQAVKARLPNRVGIADSLRMGDMAVEMVAPNEDGLVPPATAIACLGVDFMSESVQAILGKNGYEHVPVYRATPNKIGCSLAESAERDGYRAWLQQQGAGGNALHVVYINTSLETKAVSASLVPTITCTSSNVLQTLLQASAQMGPDLERILYGPDTYMGENLVTLLDTLCEEDSGWDNARIAKQLHPQHDLESLRRLRNAIDVFPEGNCVVHHMFGASVVDTVRNHYEDAFVTAHLEVPGEMFQIAMEKSLTDHGVVGSTSDILKFITRKVQQAAASETTVGRKQRLKFILGTEAGMVTSIVESVQNILEQTRNTSVEAEIIFPVASDAVMGTEDNNNDMPLVPGVGGGEGCSTAGGCATCPYMKMNDLDALMDVIELVQQGESSRLQRHLPPNRLRGRLIQGRSATDLGSEPILYMRALMKDGQLPEELVNKIAQRQ